jgi:hypothetical protein
MQAAIENQLNIEATGHGPKHFVLQLASAIPCWLSALRGIERKD